MSIVTGYQLIYARVEAKYSPRNKSGYQTVYHSPSISSAEVRAIEKRIQCFDTSDDVPRYQFFILETGKIVLTDSATVDTDPEAVLEIIDRQGRPGTFITHCLVFTPAEFAKVGNNPFPIFGTFGFCADPREMVNLLNQPEEHKAIVEIGARNQRVNWSSNTPQNDADKLLALARQTSQAILIYGSESEIFELLSNIFAVAEPSARLKCSFDTHIEKCIPKPGTYWAVGASTRQRGTYSVEINADEGNLGNVLAAPSLEPDDTYGKWIGGVVQKNDIDLLQNVDTGQDLANAFQEQREPRESLYNKKAYGVFFEMNRDIVRNRIAETIAMVPTSQAFGIAMSEYLLQTSDVKDLICIAAPKHIVPDFLNRVMTQWFQTQAPNFVFRGMKKKTDWYNLYRYASDQQQYVLAFWLAAYLEDSKLCQDTLPQMSDEMYTRALEMLLRPFVPSHFISPRHTHMDALMQTLEPDFSQMPDEQALSFALDVIRAGLSGYLAILNLENIITKFSDDEVVSLVEGFAIQREWPISSSLVNRVFQFSDRQFVGFVQDMVNEQHGEYLTAFRDRAVKIDDKKSLKKLKQLVKQKIVPHDFDQAVTSRWNELTEPRKQNHRKATSISKYLLPIGIVVTGGAVIGVVILIAVAFIQQPDSPKVTNIQLGESDIFPDDPATTTVSLDPNTTILLTVTLDNLSPNVTITTIWHLEEEGRREEVHRSVFQPVGEETPGRYISESEHHRIPLRPGVYTIDIYYGHDPLATRTFEITVNPEH